MKFIRQILADLLCRPHDLVFVRNIYGDEIVHSGCFKRSWWQCAKCGAWKSKPHLHKDAA